MSYVFFGGMRGTAWVNMFQTILFLGFGTIAFVLISKNLGGFDRIMAELAADPKTAPLLTPTHPGRGVLQLHADPAFGHHVPAHRHHVHDGGESFVV